MLTYTIYDKQTVEEYLNSFHLGKHIINELIHGQHVLLDNVPLKNEDLLLPGQKIDIEELDSFKGEMPNPTFNDIVIIYDDQDCVVVYKRQGIVIYDENQEVTLLSDTYGALKKKGFSGTLYPVSRLDYDTQGLVVIAKNKLSAASLSYQFEHNEIKKVYLAVIKGKMREQKGTINFKLGRNRHNDNMMVVTEKGKESITHYETLKATNECSLVKVQIDTGRTHQIRVHFSYLNHPLIGDTLYNPQDNSGEYLRLIAQELTFYSVYKHKAMHFSVNKPFDFMPKLK